MDRTFLTHYFQNTVFNKYYFDIIHDTRFR